MKLQNVVWYEGMKLNPHHFQQIDRYNQYYINSKINILNSNYWGLTEIQIDLAALSGGSFNFVNVRVLCRMDYFLICLAMILSLKADLLKIYFQQQQRKLDVFLSIPLENISGNNCQMNESVNSNNSQLYSSKCGYPGL